jgi:hypothetical protein
VCEEQGKEKNPAKAANRPVKPQKERQKGNTNHYGDISPDKLRRDSHWSNKRRASQYKEYVTDIASHHIPHSYVGGTEDQCLETHCQLGRAGSERNDGQTYGKR